MKSAGFRDRRIESRWAGQALGKVAFLRHKIPPLEHRETSDWDLAVRDLEQVISLTHEILGQPLLTVRRVYVEQRYYRWGQIDFLPSFQWNGFVFLEWDRFWSGVVVSEDGLPRPRLVHDALIAWLTGLLNGAAYNPRYDQLLQEAWKTAPGEFRDCLEWAFGAGLADEMGDLLDQGIPANATKLTPDLRKALKSRSVFRSPGESLEGVVRHWSRELFLHWKPPFPWLAFLGPDGVGKSTVIEGVEDLLAPSRLKSLLVHWRPKMSGHEPTDGVPVTDPHARPPRGFIASTLALILLWFRWMVGRFGRTWHQRAKEKILVSDRYYPDLLVDPLRYRYGGSLGLARWIFRFFPKPDLTLILHGDPGVIRKRKQEVPAEEVTRQVAAYRALGNELPNRTILVDAGRDKEVVLDEIRRIVLKHLFARKR